MIGIKLNGRLGNQLFQYAFALSLSKKLSTDFYLDRSIIKFILPEFFCVKRDILFYLDKYVFSINGFKNIFSYHLRNKFYNIYYLFFCYKNITISNDFQPYEELKKIKNNAIYDGFYQSELYFLNVSDHIRTQFIIRRKYTKIFETLYKSLPIKGKKIVTIHIRQGDYKSLGLNLGLDYYHKIIKQLEPNNYFYIFISDEPESIKKEFDYLSNSFFSENTEIIDFQFLLKAQICILSNSSFSWWGAYLNKNNPLVFAPKFWLGKTNEYPISIISKKWKKK